MFQHFGSHWRMAGTFVIFSTGLLVFHALIGTPEGSSYQFNLPWYDSFRDAFWSGDLYPRFLPDLWYGVGALDFYFYGPLPFWLVAIFGEATCPGCGTGTVFSIGGAWMIIFSGVTFYFLSRRFFEPAWAGFSAFVYMLLPYHYLIDWFYRQSVGEVAALIFLPLLILSTIRLIEDRKGGAMFAISFAAIALSHVPTTLIVVHLLIILVTWTVISREPSWQTRLAILARFAGWGALGTALSAIYWVPALSLLDSVSPDMLYSDYFDATRWLLLDGIPEVEPIISMGTKVVLLLVVVSAIIASLILNRLERPPSTLLLWIVGPSFFAAFLMTTFAYPVWQYWILNKVQFPFRVLTMSEVSIALAVTVIARHLVETRKTAQARLASLFATLTLGALVLAYVTQVPLATGTTSSGLERAGEFEKVGVPEYVPPGYLAPAYTRFKQDMANGARSEDQFAVFFNQMNVSRDQAFDALRSDAPGAVLTALTGDRVRLQVELAEPGMVRVPIASWPHWRARTLSGESLSVGTDATFGIIQLELPQGRTDLELYIIETAPQKVGSSLSFMALLILIGYALMAGFRGFVSTNKPLATSSV